VSGKGVAVLDAGSCLDENELVAYLDGHPGIRSAEAIEEHIDGCATCRLLLSTMAALAADESSSSGLASRGGPSAREYEERRALDDGEELFAGDRIEHFEVIRPLGRGGMGVVYLARDQKLGRKVALKVLHSHPDNARAMRALLAEARTTAALNHPNIVAIYSVGSATSPYIGLEYIEGQTLHERLISAGPLSPGEVARIGCEIANALAAAHSAQVLHRDLKPRNVMLGADGRVRVLDFGLAEPLAAQRSGSEELAGSEVPTRLRGTPAYIAPELWRGQVASPASDCWALGVLLLQLLSGENPLRAESMRSIREQVLRSDPRELTASLVDRAPSLARLLRKLLEHDPERRPSARAVASALSQEQRGRVSSQDALELSPYRGLSPFAQGDAAYFYGRDAEINALLELLNYQPRVAVIGPSGSGKSSLCRAGVLPHLEEQDHVTLVMRPGPRPFFRLAQQLSDIGGSELEELVSTSIVAGEESPTGRLEAGLRAHPVALGQALRKIARARRRPVTLLVDQLEELLIQVEDPDQRRRFLASLAQAADEPEEPVRLLLSVRDDFVTRLIEVSGDREALGPLFALFPPDDEMLRAAFMGPLEAVGYGVDDPSLPGEIVATLRGVRGGLPLLQFTAQRLWQQRDREQRLLLRETYEQLGGVGGALAQHADRQLARLTEQERQLARQLLLRLVSDEGARRPQPRAQLLSGLEEPAEEVLRQLIVARLLVATREEDQGDVVVELAHESLTQRWETLASWLLASRDDLRFFRDVEPVALRWQQQGEPRDALWRGDQLLEAQAVLRRATASAPSSVERFLRAGARARRRRSMVLRGVALVAFAATVAIGMLLAHQGREARRLGALAELRRAEADGRRAEAERQRAATLRGGALNALGSGKLLEARAKLRLSLELEDSTEARALWARLAADSRHWRRHVAPSLRAIALLGDRLLAVAGLDHDIYLMDPQTARPLRLLRGHSDKVNALVFSQTSGMLASAGEAGGIRLWHAASGKALARLRGHRRDVLNLAFSPDGKLLASASADGTLRLWDVERRRQVGQRHDQGSSIDDVEFTRDGRWLYSCGRDGTLWRRTLPTLEGRSVYRGARRLTRLALHPKRPWAAVTDASGQVVLLDRRDGRVLQRSRRAGRLLALAFSPDGRWLAAGGRGKVLYLWPVSARGLDQGQRVLRTGGSVRALGFSTDGRWVGVASRDGAVTLARPALPPRPDAGHRGPITGMTLSPDGKTVATCGEDRRVRLWEVESGDQRASFVEREKVVDLAYSPDGALLATGSDDGTVRLRHSKSLDVVATLKGHGSRVFRLRFSPDGSLLASTSYDRTVRLWDVRQRRVARTLRGYRQFVLDAAFSPDGRWLATTAGDRVRVWDLRRPRGRSRDLGGHSFWVYCLAFTRDGGLLSGSFDRSVRRWSLQGGASRELIRAPARVHTVAVHPDGRRLGTCHSDGTVRLWAAGGRPLQLLRTHPSEVNRIGFTPDGKGVLSAGDDGTLRSHLLRDGRPRWRGAGLLGSPPRLLDHRGWRAPGGKPLTADAPWERRAAAGKASLLRVRGPLACLLFPGGEVELWRVRGAKPVATLDAADPARDVIVLEHACAARSRRGVVRWIGADGRVSQLRSRGARALGRSDVGGLLVATSTQVEVYDRRGRLTDTRKAAPGITALALRGDTLVAGYRNGIVELSSSGVTRLLPDTPSEQVLRLRFGPRETLAVGFAGGTVALWDTVSGARLGRRHLHGPVEHLLFHGDRLHALSRLGSALTWDLPALRRSRCALLRRIWRRVGVSWIGGRASRRGPPLGHPCLRRGR
jgi:WD40 repeat protein/serine/threonine protein kinase/energy-coupling factor transporter ATP-binding protein EcfA2